MDINPRSWSVLAVAFVYGICLVEAIHMVFLPVNTFVCGHVVDVIIVLRRFCSGTVNLAT